VFDRFNFRKLIMRMKIRGGLIITARDICLILGLDGDCSGRRKHLEVRDALGIKSKYITIKTFCDYFEFPYEETVEFLNDNR